MSVFWIVLWIVCAGICAIVAQAKGRSTLGWGLIGLFTGVFGVVVLAMLPALSERGGSERTPSYQPRKPEPELPPLRLGKSDAKLDEERRR
jgi:hypothetical protein